MNLRVIINNRNDESGEINDTLSKGNTSMGLLMKVMKSKIVLRTTKERIYRTMLRLTILYGSKLWTINQAEEKKLEVWETRILTKIYGKKDRRMGKKNEQ